MQTGNTFPEIDMYHTKNLYRPHSTKPNLWAFAARADDLITFNNSEKLNPITMETFISGHPKVRSAVIGGNGQFQASLLIEPIQHPRNEKEKQELLQHIWPMVREANQACPGHGRIMKDFIIFTTPEKPMPRAGKETIQRHAALALYDPEFEALYEGSHKPKDRKELCRDRGEEPHYATAVNNGEFKGILPESNPETQVEAVLRRLLPNILRQQLGGALAEAAIMFLKSDATAPKNFEKVNEIYLDEIPTKLTKPSLNMKEVFYDIMATHSYLVELSDNVNLFESGLDSLQIIVLVKEINPFLSEQKHGAKPINIRTFFDNPTIEQLAAALDIVKSEGP